MVKTKHDFDNYDDFRKYSKTSDFLLAYSWEGKSRETIIEEMALPNFEIEFLDEALAELERQGNQDYSGMTLDCMIMRKFDDSIVLDDFDPAVAEYVEYVDDYSGQIERGE